jgi:hypothetical protein
VACQPSSGFRAKRPPARIRSPDQELPIAGPAQRAHRTTPEPGRGQATDSRTNRQAGSVCTAIPPRACGSGRSQRVTAGEPVSVGGLQALEPFRAVPAGFRSRGGRPEGASGAPGAWRLPLSCQGRGRSRACRPRAPCGQGRARRRRPRCAARPPPAAVIPKPRGQSQARKRWREQATAPSTRRRSTRSCPTCGRPPQVTPCWSPSAIEP